VGQSKYDLSLQRAAGRMAINITHSGNITRSGPDTLDLTLAPSFPLDARVRAVEVQGRSVEFQTSRIGDRLRASVNFEMREQSVEVVFIYDGGSDVYVKPEIPAPGAESQGLRVLRSIADDRGLHLIVEGLGSRSYPLFVRAPQRLEEITGVGLGAATGTDQLLNVKFEGSPDVYVRRELTIPFNKKAQ
jgi:hypothetical protein